MHSWEIHLNELSGAENFKRLSVEEQLRYRQNLKDKLSYARNLAFPICFAPELDRDGKINSATGFMLKLSSGLVLVTASHVLEGYEDRLNAGEKLHWLVGKLPPFDPLSRVIWRDTERDIVILRMAMKESDHIGEASLSTVLDMLEKTVREWNTIA